MECGHCHLGQSNKAFLSRDRFAEKPLYYIKTNRGLYFGSNKSMQSMLSKKLEINTDHLKRYLVYGYKFLYKTSDKYFKNLKELSYATNATIDLNLEIKTKKYWIPKVKKTNINIDDAINETKHHLLSNSKLRLRSDVPALFERWSRLCFPCINSQEEFGYDVTLFLLLIQIKGILK